MYVVEIPEFLFRYVLTHRIVKKIEKGDIGFSTILIGSSKKAINIYNQIMDLPKSSGYKLIGLVETSGEKNNFFSKKLKNLGTLSNLDQIIKHNQIDEAIIALENEEFVLIEKTLYELNYQNIIAKIIPNKSDLILGNVKMSSIHGIPFTEIHPSSMNLFESFIKRKLDIIISLLALIVLFPIFIFNAFIIKLSSKGPVFYSQERAGKHRKIFKIIKFRSMYINAESEGKPKLTQENDNRITSWGKIMRKYRIDELPQFYNVLKGEMSLVGPRPERNYFIEKIIKKAPHYKLVFKIRPGITSWGMVKYGYADNVEKMIERLKYDIIYLENLSIFSDIKVLAYTLIIVLQGRGK